VNQSSNTRRLGLYLRVSTEEQVRIQDGSLVSQRQRLEEYVEGQNRREPGWGSIVGVYCEEGRSAKDMNRPEFQKLLSDIRSGHVNMVLATELSRLSRSIKDFCEIWELFKKYNVGFVTLRESIDTSNAAGQMMVFNLINFAQYERMQTAERISANWASRAKRGLWNGGSIPLGFDRNPKSPGELLRNDEEAKQVKTIFETFLKMGSVRKTCLELSKQGVFSKHYTNKHGIDKGGKHITVMSLQGLLTNRAYLGLREIDKKKPGETQVVKASWPALIEADLFKQVQERLALNKNKYKPDEYKTYPYPLTELLICGECGKHLGGKSAHGKNRKHFYYGHPRQIHSDGVTHLKRCRLERVRAPRTEELILKSLKKLVDDPTQIDRWLDIHTKGTQSELPGVEGRIKTLDGEIRTQAKRQENLMGRLADLPSEIPADLIYKQLQAIQEKARELEETRKSLSHHRQAITTKSVDRERLLFKIRRTIANLEKAPVEDQRPIFSNLIQFAELHPTKVRLGVFAPVQDRERSLESLNTRSNPQRAGSTSVCFGA
jgi:site-specific DNA recombinase